MTQPGIIEHAAADGVAVTLTPTGTIKARGNHEHGHDRGLAVTVCIGYVLNETLAGLANYGCNLGQPDCCFDCFQLTEEGSDTAELVMPPVLEQACGFGGYAPVVRARYGAPLIDLLAHAIDDGRVDVLLVSRRKTFAFIEQQRFLLG